MEKPTILLGNLIPKTSLGQTGRDQVRKRLQVKRREREREERR